MPMPKHPCQSPCQSPPSLIPLTRVVLIIICAPVKGRAGATCCGAGLRLTQPLHTQLLGLRGSGGGGREGRRRKEGEGEE